MTEASASVCVILATALLVSIHFVDYWLGRTSLNMEDDLSLVFTFLILMTCMHYNAQIWYGEIWCWSLIVRLGLRELTPPTLLSGSLRFELTRQQLATWIDNNDGDTSCVVQISKVGRLSVFSGSTCISRMWTVDAYYVKVHWWHGGEILHFNFVIFFW